MVLYPGDMGDFYLLSKFDQNPDRANTLQDDLNSTANLFKRHRSLLPNARLIFELGNHEDRLRRYIWNNPKIASLDCLKLENLYKLHESEVECVGYEDGIIINKVFKVTHGDLIRKFSSYTAKGMMDKHGGCGMCGHSHRLGNSYKTNGFGMSGWWENGCLCDLEPDYIRHPDWQQGFSLVHFTGDRFWVQQMQIINRKFMYGGRVYGSGGKARV